MSNDDVLAAQIKSSIITKIKTQEYLPGELLPSERDFATMYSVSRYLIHDIFDELISQHYLIRVHGKGTFVRKPEQNRVALGVLNESKNASFTSLVRNFGIEISNKCLGTGIIKNRKYFADKLGLSWKDQEMILPLRKENQLPNTRIWSFQTSWENPLRYVQGNIRSQILADLKQALEVYRVDGTSDPSNLAVQVVCDF